MTAIDETDNASDPAFETEQSNPSSQTNDALQAVHDAFQYGRQLHGLPTDAQEGAIPGQQAASGGAAPSTSQSQANDNSEAAWTGGASQRPAQGAPAPILNTTPRPLPIAPPVPTFGRRADAGGAIPANEMAFASGGEVPDPNPSDVDQATANPNPEPGQGGPRYSDSASPPPASAGAIDMGPYDDAPEDPWYKKAGQAIGRVGKSVGQALSLPSAEEATGGVDPSGAQAYLSGQGAASKETMASLRQQAQEQLASNGSDIEGGLAAQTVAQAKTPAEGHAALQNLRNEFGHETNSAVAAVDGANNKPSDPQGAIEHANKASQVFPDGNKVQWSYRRGATAGEDAYLATVTPPTTGNPQVDKDNPPNTYSLTGPQFKAFLNQGQHGQFDQMYETGYGNTLKYMQTIPGTPLTPRTSTQHGWDESGGTKLLGRNSRTGEPIWGDHQMKVITRGPDRKYVVDRDGKITNEATPEDAALYGGAQNVQRTNAQFPNMGGSQDRARLQAMEAGRQQDIHNEQLGTKINQPSNVAQIRSEGGVQQAGIAGQAKTDAAETLAGSREYGADARSGAVKYAADAARTWHTDATQAKIANDLQSLETKRLDSQDQSAVKFLVGKLAAGGGLAKDEINAAARLIGNAGQGAPGQGAAPPNQTPGQRGQGGALEKTGAQAPPGPGARPNKFTGQSSGGQAGVTPPASGSIVEIDGVRHRVQ